MGPTVVTAQPASDHCVDPVPEIPDQPADELVAPLHETPVLLVDTAVVGQRYRSLSAALPGVASALRGQGQPGAAGAADAGRDSAAGGTSPARAKSTRCWPRAATRPTCPTATPSRSAADIAYAVAPRRAPVHRRQPRRADEDHRLAPGATVLVRLTTSGAGADWALGGKFGCSGGRGGRPARRPRMSSGTRWGWPSMSAANSGTRRPGTRRWPPTARLRAGLRRSGARPGGRRPGWRVPGRDARRHPRRSPSTAPPSPRRSGGISVRDRRR